MISHHHFSDGIATTRDLIAAGVSPSEIRSSLHRRHIVPIRRGVVAIPGCDDNVLAAARIGGRLAAASAARYHGVWTPPRRGLIVEVPRGKHVDLSRADVIRGPSGPARFGASPLPDLVRQILRTEPTPYAVAVLDSILNSTPMTRFELEEAASSLPAHLKAPLGLLDDRSESGTESVVRVLLALDGIVATPQVRVPFSNLDRLDLVVGDRLVIECDSRQFHSTNDDLERDNARDLQLVALGFVVLRVRYHVVMYDPEAVVAAVRRLVDDGIHLDRSAPSRRDTL